MVSKQARDVLKNGDDVMSRSGIRVIGSPCAQWISERLLCMKMSYTVCPGNGGVEDERTASVLFTEEIRSSVNIYATNK